MAGYRGCRDKDIPVPDLSAWHSLPRGFIGGNCTYAPAVKM